MFEYKYGSYYIIISDDIIGKYGYPPNMKSNAKKEYFPDINNISIEYINIGENIINYFLYTNPNFIFPLFRSYRNNNINIFIKLRYIRYYLTYINKDLIYQPFLKIIEADTFLNMQKAYNNFILYTQFIDNINI